LLILILVACVALGSGYVGVMVGQRFERNQLCCSMPRWRNLKVSLQEAFGMVSFYSQIGQDKWVAEAVFPGARNGFFVDVGSADGTISSNTKALEQRGWTGVCIDPFPSNMQDRTCQMLREVVFIRSGERVKFKKSGEIGGIEAKLGIWKDRTKASPTVEFTTVTLGEILERTHAPQFIHFMSLDIEGAELDALQAFPFDKYRLGALAVEHNGEEPKRTEIRKLLTAHGYELSHSWLQDDFYVVAVAGQK
jgi:FkbM family methyltransferase